MTEFPMEPNGIETIKAALVAGDPNSRRKKSTLPPLADLARSITFDLETGFVAKTRLVSDPNREGQRYLMFTAGGTGIYAHRFLVSVALGRWISGDVVVDHIDRNPSNNALENLRVTVPAENNANRRAPIPFDRLVTVDEAQNQADLLRRPIPDAASGTDPDTDPDADMDAESGTDPDGTDAVTDTESDVDMDALEGTDTESDADHDDDVHGRSSDRALDQLHDDLEADDNLSDDLTPTPEQAPTPEPSDPTPLPEATPPTDFDERRDWYRRRALSNDHQQNLADRAAILADLAAGRLDYGPFADREDPCLTDRAQAALDPDPVDPDPDAFAVCACGALKYHRERLTWYERKGPSWLFIGKLPIKRSFNL